MDEIIRTNRELRKQLAEDDEIISNYEAKIKSLERDLEHSNLEIHYLGKSLIQRETEIDVLKKDNTDLSIQLRKALKDIESKEKFITFREDQFIALEDKISTYNKKPKMSSTRRIQPPNPNEIEVNADIISDGCRDLDIFIQRPQNSTLDRNTSVNKLNEITTSAHRLRDIAKWNDDQLAPLRVQIHQNLQALNQVNTQLTRVQTDLNQLHQDHLQVNVENTQLKNIQDQIVNAQTQFINNTHNPLAQNHIALIQANNQLNQAHNFQTGQLQLTQQKYAKWKHRARNLNVHPDVIWFIDTPN